MSDTDEHSGPHPAVAATRNEGNLVINTKTMMMLGALLLGGTVGGGGISLATKAPSAPVTAPEVTAALVDLNAKVVASNVTLGAITVTLAEMKQQLNSTSRENDKRDADVADHEARLRRLEGRR